MLNARIETRLKLYETAKLVISKETTLIPKTAEKGFPYISTKVEAQITGTLVLEKIAEIHSQYDAIIIAAFGDPGLIPAKTLFNLPIIGLGEAAMLSACLFGKKFSIISFTNAMASWYEESVEVLGLQSRYAGFRAIDGVNLTIDKIQTLQKKSLIESAKLAINMMVVKWLSLQELHCLDLKKLFKKRLVFLSLIVLKQL